MQTEQFCPEQIVELCKSSFLKICNSYNANGLYQPQIPQKHFAYLDSSDHIDIFKPHLISTYRYKQGHEIK